MAAAVQVLNREAVEKVRVDQEAAALRAAADFERGRTAAERARAAAEQGAAIETLARGLGKVPGGDLTARLDDGFLQGVRAYAAISTAPPTDRSMSHSRRIDADRMDTGRSPGDPLGALSALSDAFVKGAERHV